MTTVAIITMEATPVVMIMGAILTIKTARMEETTQEEATWSVKILLAKASASTNNKNATGVANKTLASRSIQTAKMTTVAITVEIIMVEMTMDVILTIKTATAMTAIMMETMEVAITMEETTQEMARSVLPL